MVHTFSIIVFMTANTNPCYLIKSYFWELIMFLANSKLDSIAPGNFGSSAQLMFANWFILPGIIVPFCDIPVKQTATCPLLLDCCIRRNFIWILCGKTLPIICWVRIARHRRKNIFAFMVLKPSDFIRTLQIQ
jgi:hypothetical protein